VARVFLPNQQVRDIPIGTAEGIPEEKLRRALVPVNSQDYEIVRMGANDECLPLEGGRVMDRDTVAMVPRNRVG